jgi:hypothetical protein
MWRLTRASFDDEHRERISDDEFVQTQATLARGRA